MSFAPCTAILTAADVKALRTANEAYRAAEHAACLARYLKAPYLSDEVFFGLSAPDDDEDGDLIRHRSSPGAVDGQSVTALVALYAFVTKGLK